jgi:hypothetical protein
MSLATTARRRSPRVATIQRREPPGLDAFYVKVNLPGRARLTGSGEPSDRLSIFEAQLFREPDEDQISTLMGRFLNVAAALNAGEPLVDIFDCDGDEDYGYGNAVFAGDGWRPEIERACEMWPANLLVLYRMVLHDSIRGRNVGLPFMKAVLASSCIPSGTVALIRSFALGHASNSAAVRAGTARLAAYWKLAGFKRIARSAFHMRLCQ